MRSRNGLPLGSRTCVSLGGGRMPPIVGHEPMACNLEFLPRRLLRTVGFVMDGPRFRSMAMTLIGGYGAPNGNGFGRWPRSRWMAMISIDRCDAARYISLWSSGDLMQN